VNDIPKRFYANLTPTPSEKARTVHDCSAVGERTDRGQEQERVNPRDQPVDALRCSLRSPRDDLEQQLGCRFWHRHIRHLVDHDQLA
jgi:hypothetical protein